MEKAVFFLGWEDKVMSTEDGVEEFSRELLAMLTLLLSISNGEDFSRLVPRLLSAAADEGEDELSWLLLLSFLLSFTLRSSA